MTVSNITLFGIDFKIDRVAFNIPGIDWPVYWYGIIITLGFVLAVLYGMTRAKSFGIDPDKLLDALLVTAPAAIIGARLYYIIFDSDVGLSEFFLIKNGGLAILGAVIAAVLVGYIMCKVKKVNIYAAFDLAALGFLIGQGVGRWGNFINQEAYGTFTNSSWFGMTGNRIAYDMKSTELVHPCFLYESIWCLAGFVLLHILSKRRKFVGQIAVLYLIWYGIGRFFIEGLRTDSLMIGTVRVSQLLSACMVIFGIILLAINLKRKKIRQQEKEYYPVFDIEKLENVSFESNGEQQSNDQSQLTEDDNQSQIDEDKGEETQANNDNEETQANNDNEEAQANNDADEKADNSEDDKGAN